MIIYLHGFSSSAKSNKARAIKAYFMQYEILIPDYPSHQPENSISYLTELIRHSIKSKNENRIMLMGSSLGGFYAQFLATKINATVAVVLINPCLQPQITLMTQIGEQTNSVTSEQFRFEQKHFDEFSQYDIAIEKLFVPALVLLDEGDEVIDYQVAANRYKDKGRVLAYPGGDHWFRHLDSALPEIESFYKLHIKN